MLMRTNLEYKLREEDFSDNDRIIPQPTILRPQDMETFEDYGRNRLNAEAGIRGLLRDLYGLKRLEEYVFDNIQESILYTPSQTQYDKAESTVSAFNEKVKKFDKKAKIDSKNRELHLDSIDTAILATLIGVLDNDSEYEKEVNNIPWLIVQTKLLRHTSDYNLDHLPELVPAYLKESHLTTSNLYLVEPSK